LGGGWKVSWKIVVKELSPPKTPKTTKANQTHKNKGIKSKTNMKNWLQPETYNSKNYVR
jgi:hypothetical protein